MRRPRVILNCVADNYVSGPERIVEVSSANGGCLISLRELDDGTLRIDVYNADPTVSVIGPPGPAGAGGEDMTTLAGTTISSVRTSEGDRGFTDHLMWADSCQPICGLVPPSAFWVEPVEGGTRCPACTEVAKVIARLRRTLEVSSGRAPGSVN